MSTFKKIHTKNYSKPGSTATSDSLYWKNLEFPVTVKEYAAIDYIDVSSQEPYYIAVTAGLKVDIYHQQTAKVWKTLTRFPSKAYGGTFRQDGQLLVAGAENGQVMLFNYRLKQILRIFKGHTGPVHRAKFIPGQSQIVSFSDDKTVSLWDMTSEKKICTMEGHTDFLRSGCVNPASDHLVLSGSYDHTVKLWDTRTSESVFSVDHGSPVESIVCYPSGSVFVSAGGTELKVWDMISRRLLSKVSQHHKAITCLTLATDNKRLVSASLDQNIKIYDVDNYSVVHTMKYMAPILSVAVAPGDSTVAVGMISSGAGLISLEHRKDPEKNPAPMSKKKMADIRNLNTENFTVVPGDEVIRHSEIEKLPAYDLKLKKFKYSQVLDVVMSGYMCNKSPYIVVSVLMELLRRNGLCPALAGRNAKTLTPVFRFVTRFIRDPKFKHVLIDVANALLDIYGNRIDEFPYIIKLIRRLKEEVDSELNAVGDNVGMMGIIEMFLASSDHTISSTPTPVNLTLNNNEKVHHHKTISSKKSVLVT